MLLVRCVLLLVIFLISSARVWSASPSFVVDRVGLYGNNYIANILKDVSEGDYAVGYAVTNFVSQHPWIYDGNTTTQIGLMGTGYISKTGFEYSDVIQLNDVGHVVGFSNRYTPDGNECSTYWHDCGKAIWFYDGNQTIEIGLTGSEYTNSDGFIYNWSNYNLNNNDQLTGYVEQWSGNNSVGRLAWMYNDGQTIKLGLDGNGYRDFYGKASSEANLLNNFGYVAGVSYRFDSVKAVHLGNVSWIYNSNTNIYKLIGLTGDKYVCSNGYMSGLPTAINDSNQVSGYSLSCSYGTEAWFYNGIQTIKIGFSDGIYLKSNGHFFNYPRYLNNSGQVVGFSRRFIEGCVVDDIDSCGQETWFYSGAKTQKIGLNGNGYTRSDGYKYNDVRKLNELGQAIGIINRYSGNNDMGKQAWLYTNNQSIALGLTGNNYVRDDGYIYSEAERINNAGQVTGYSKRFSNHDDIGQTAWLYDSTSNQTVELILSARADGYSVSEVRYLGEDGLVVGGYELFDGLTSLGGRAFYYKKDEGFFDLGPLVTNLDDFNWDKLAIAISGTCKGNIVGAANNSEQFFLKKISGENVNDSDNDGLIDSCDSNDDNDDNSDIQELNCGSNTVDADSFCPSVIDTDVDGVSDAQDNCLLVFNDQIDIDNDNTGDACDLNNDNDANSDAEESACGSNPLNAASFCSNVDADSDGVPNINDNCPNISNINQEDSDRDGMGDVCDAFANNEDIKRADEIKQISTMQTAIDDLKNQLSTIVAGKESVMQQYSSLLDSASQHLDNASQISLSIQDVNNNLVDKSAYYERRKVEGASKYELKLIAGEQKALKKQIKNLQKAQKNSIKSQKKVLSQAAKLVKKNKISADITQLVQKIQDQEELLADKKLEFGF